MDHLESLRRQIRQYMGVLIVIENLILIGVWYGLDTYSSLDTILIAVILAALGVAGAFVITLICSNLVLQPVQALWQTVLHLSPSVQGVAPPKPEQLKVGRELVANLSAQIYQLATVAEQVAAKNNEPSKLFDRNFVAQNLPLPLILIDSSETIIFANNSAAQYIGSSINDLIGKSIYMAIDMSFPSEDTFDTWLKDVKVKSATASNSWERVRLNVRDNHPSRLFDLAAYYNRDNPEKIETMLVLFDHTKQYSQDEQAVSFIALSVHELRTPLTLLRGYIEVFEEELGDHIDPELVDFMSKMHAQAEQLTAFVNNILNVARIDDDQLELQLQEEDWGVILKDALDMISLRAKVRGIVIHCKLAPDLPKVGVDRLSIREVVNNLIDNAIKYSGTSKTIEVNVRVNQEGLVETTVQDFGLGIATGVMPNLFTKFYRDHRNRAQIGGTGLGLYLSKAIVTAHGGSIWVRSKEGQGSTFGFTILPYSQVAAEVKANDNQEIVRGAHGWIKNHSLYRR